LYEAPDGAFDVRAAVEGDVDPFAVHRRVIGDPTLARRLGTAVGGILAEQHAAVAGAGVAGRRPTPPARPPAPPPPPAPLPPALLRARLPHATDDAGLLVRIEVVLARYEGLVVTEADRALVHTDVGFHNLAIEPATLAVRGIFDYAGAAWADRHHDFRYLV